MALEGSFLIIIEGRSNVGKIISALKIETPVIYGCFPDEFKPRRLCGDPGETVFVLPLHNMSIGEMVVQRLTGTGVMHSN